MFQNRYNDNTIELDFYPVPHCRFCGREMCVKSRSRPHNMAGKAENCRFITASRHCGSSACPGNLENPIAPENHYVLPRCEFHYEVQPLICELRFKHSQTGNEIAVHLRVHHGTWIDVTTVRDIVISPKVPHVVFVAKLELT